MYPFNLVIGLFRISNYELFNFIGLALLVIFEVALLDRDALVNRWQVLLACTIGILIGTTGAKLTHLMLYAEKYRGMSPEKVFMMSGHAYIGGACLALLVIYLLFRFYKVSFLYAGDYTLPYFGLFRAIGRIGCLFTGCCVGSTSNLPWALYFRDGLLRHPTQAYMIVLTFSIFAAGRLNYKKMRDTPGLVFFLSVTMYGLIRFFIEFFRVDSPLIIGPLKLSHIVLLIVFIYGGAGIITLCRRYLKEADVAYLIRRYLSNFVMSMIVTGLLILTLLTFMQKANYEDEIDFCIDKKGMHRIEAVLDPDFEHIVKIRRALRLYRYDNETYPTQEQGLNALVVKPNKVPIPKNWKGPYLGDLDIRLKDGKEYKYEPYLTGDIWSYKLIASSDRIKTAVTLKPREYILEAEIHHALLVYKMDTGQYPTEEQGLNALTEKPAIAPVPDNWRGPYIDAPLRDKQERQYIYRPEKRLGKDSYLLYKK